MQAHADILGRDTYYLTYLFVGQILEPQQYDGAIEGLQARDALVEHIYLAGILVAVLEQVDVHRDVYLHLPAFLLPVLRDTGIQGDAIDPRFDVGSLLEPFETLPQVYQHLLKEVFHLVGILREHVAHGIYRAAMLFYGLRKLFF